MPTNRVAKETTLNKVREEEKAATAAMFKDFGMTVEPERNLDGFTKEYEYRDESGAVDRNMLFRATAAAHSNRDYAAQDRAAQLLRQNSPPGKKRGRGKD